MRETKRFSGKPYYYAGWAKTMAQSKRVNTKRRKDGLAARYYPEARGYSLWTRPAMNPVDWLTLGSSAVTGLGLGVGLGLAQRGLKKVVGNPTSIPREIVQEAKKDKKWAEKAIRDEKWWKGASTWSRETAVKWSKLSVNERAKQKWDYLKYRAHAKDVVFGREVYVDKLARARYLKLVGR